ncbi:MAG: phosphatase PAP2 family protein [Lachnospiraceae bacterium]|nr:phosphatase PAP2 family protein [Lachnospiraceae bacterium]
MEVLWQIEGNILLWIQEYVRADWLNPIVNFITNLGNAGWFWLLLLAAMLFFKKTRKTGITGLIAMLIGFIITNVCLKNLVARVRPYEVIEGLEYITKTPSDWSFPSGHSTASMAASVVLFCKLPKKYGVPVLVLGILISLSRLYVGVHYPTDVIVGMLVGWFGAFMAMKIMSKNTANC